MNKDFNKKFVIFQDQCSLHLTKYLLRNTGMENIKILQDKSTNNFNNIKNCNTDKKDINKILKFINLILC